MAKELSYVCTECSGLFSKWMGQCSECGAWNSIEKQAAVFQKQKSSSFALAGETNEIQAINEVTCETHARIKTPLAELDRVLGGGIVSGSVILVGGNPGIGKSTLLLQVLSSFDRERALYVTGEESLQQVALRAERLGYKNSKLRVLASNNLEEILANAMRERPNIMVIDSIQTLSSEKTPSAAGSVSQVRECANQITQFAKQTDTTVFVVGHVTKDGSIAGPRVLEHVVDTVLYFEGDSSDRFRLLRATKNRFGAVNELGIFVMQESGLKGVKNPSALFLSHHQTPAAGSVVMVTREGTRPLMVEVQALVDDNPSNNTRRLAQGVEQNRLSMLLAVLHRHAGISLHNEDVFINVVGGVRVNEPAADLPVLLATLSSFRDFILPREIVVFGEVGLAGEIRPVPNGQERLREASKHGFTQAIIPSTNMPKETIKGLEIFPVSRLADAVEFVVNKYK